MPELTLAVDARPTTIAVVLTWMARLAVVAAFVFIGATKANSNPRGRWVEIFQLIGWGQWFRYVTGTVQVTGALLLTWRTITLGAFLLVCTMIGAMIVDVVVVHAVGLALMPLILIGIVTATWFTATFGAAGRAP